MTIKFNKSILENYGLEKMRDFELLKVLNDKLQFLLSHNKNYTKKQYYELQDIAEIITAIRA